MSDISSAAAIVSVLGSILAGVALIALLRLAFRHMRAPTPRYTVDPVPASAICTPSRPCALTGYVPPEQARRTVPTGWQAQQVDSRYYNAAKHYWKWHEHIDQTVGIDGEWRVVRDLPEPQRALPAGNERVERVPVNAPGEKVKNGG